MSPASDRTRRARVVALLAVGLCLNLALLWLYWHPRPKLLIGDESYYFALGREYAAGGAVADDPLWPPVYGAALGAAFRAFGATPVAVQVPQVLLWLAAALGLYALARRLTTERAALAGLALFVASPELMAFSHGLWPEVAHLALLLGALVAWLAPRPSLRAEAAAGACLGLAVGLKSLLVPWIPAALAARAWWGPGPRSRRWQGALVGLAAAALAASPGLWLQHRLHGRIDLAPSAVFNVWLGLNDPGCADFRDDISGLEHYAFVHAGATLPERNRLYRARIADRVASRGVGAVLREQLGKQYTRLLGYQGFFTTQLPLGAREAYGFADAPWVRVVRWLSYGYHFALLGLAALGLALTRWRSRPGLGVLAGFLGYNLVVFAFVHVTTRYLVQMLPILMLFAGVGIEAVWERFRGGASDAGSVGRWAAGSALALLAWYAAAGDALRCHGPWGLG